MSRGDDGERLPANDGADLAVSDDKDTDLDARVFDGVLLQGGAEARKELGRQIAALLLDPEHAAG